MKANFWRPLSSACRYYATYVIIIWNKWNIWKDGKTYYITYAIKDDHRILQSPAQLLHLILCYICKELILIVILLLRTINGWLGNSYKNSNILISWRGSESSCDPPIFHMEKRGNPQSFPHNSSRSFWSINQKDNCDLFIQMNKRPIHLNV